MSDFATEKHSQSEPQGAALIIPARNEALSLPAVLMRVPGDIERVIVVDNGSADETGEVARFHGAEVVFEPSPGYGSACLAGIATLAHQPPRIVAFADGDGSDGVENIPILLRPLLDGEADLALARREPDVRQALSLQQRFGNKLAVFLIRLIWGVEYHDLGPMRAVTWEALQAMHMTDRDFGWTVEMQIKAIRAKLRVVECPLPYHMRIAGQSKISRTLAGVVHAGSKILWVIGREMWRKEMNTKTILEGKARRALLVEAATDLRCRCEKQAQAPLAEGTPLYKNPVSLTHPFVHKGAGK